jgi:ribA/ribD-fused uncharacterized protein
MKKIDEFRGDWEFLSNMSDHSFIDKWGAVWKTNEHWYQAAKTPHPLLKFLLWDSPDPYYARRLANDPEMIPRLYDKETFDKEYIMLRGLEMKFQQNSEILEKLLSTTGFEIVEGNTWHDNFWGNCTCKKCKDIEGLNKLGLLIMQVRYKFGGGKI